MHSGFDLRRDVDLFAVAINLTHRLTAYKI